MTRRILFMLLGFTAIVLVGAVVPLTLNATSHDRTSFTQATEDMDRADAALAVERLDGQPDAALLSLISQVQQSGDGLVVYAGNCALPVVPDQPYPCQAVKSTTRISATQWYYLADQVAAARANFFPTLSAGPSVSRDRVSANRPLTTPQREI